MRVNIVLSVILSVLHIRGSYSSRGSLAGKIERIASAFVTKHATKFDSLQTKQFGLIAQFPSIFSRGRSEHLNGGGISGKVELHRLPIEWPIVCRTNQQTFDCAVNVAFYHLRDLFEGVTKERSNLYIPNYLVQQWKDQRLVEPESPSDLQIEQLRSVIGGILHLQDEIETHVVDIDREKNKLIATAVAEVYGVNDNESSSSSVVITPQAEPLPVPEGFHHVLSETFGFNILSNKNRGAIMGMPLARMMWRSVDKHLPQTEFRIDPLPWGKLTTQFNKNVVSLEEIKHIFVLMLKDLEFANKIKTHKINPIIQSHVDLEGALSVLERSPYVKSLKALGDEHSRPDSTTLQRRLFNLKENAKHYLGTSAVFMARTLSQANMYSMGRHYTHPATREGFEYVARHLGAQRAVDKIGASMYGIISEIESDYHAKFNDVYGLNLDLLKKNVKHIEWMINVVEDHIHTMKEKKDIDACNTMLLILDQLKNGAQTGMAEFDFKDLVQQVNAL